MQVELNLQGRSGEEWARAKLRQQSTMGDNITLAVLRHMLNVSFARPVRIVGTRTRPVRIVGTRTHPVLNVRARANPVIYHGVHT